MLFLFDVFSTLLIWGVVIFFLAYPNALLILLGLIICSKMGDGGRRGH
jgi:hypothetical protein